MAAGKPDVHQRVRPMPAKLDDPFVRSSCVGGPVVPRSAPTPAQPGTQENGIHEVTGSIPVSSTYSGNNLAKRPSAKERFVSCLCLVLGGLGVRRAARDVSDHSPSCAFSLPRPLL